MQRQTRPLEMIRHSIMKLIEQIKNKRTDILIICLLSSSNDLRTSCSKYQSVIFHSIVYLLLYIFKTSVCMFYVLSLFKCLLLFESISWKLGQVAKHQKITIIFWFLSLFCVFSGLLCKWWHHPSFFMSSFQTLNTKEFPF